MDLHVECFLYTGTGLADKEYLHAVYLEVLVRLMENASTFSNKVPYYFALKLWSPTSQLL